MNILLITADQWRADTLGTHGNRFGLTPNIDAAAAEMTDFLQHYGGAAPCSPARACLYTGLYQMNNRVCRNGSPLAARFDNIALAARRAGYTPTLFGYTDVSPDPTGMAPGDPAITSYEGVLPGFETRVKLPEHERPWLSWLRQQGLELPPGSPAHLPVGTPPGTIGTAPPAYNRDQTQTAFLTDEFIRWLGEQQDETPWFAHVSFLRPHPPFIVPAPYNTLIDSAELGSFARAASAADEAATHPFAEFLLQKTRLKHFVPGGRGRVSKLDDAAFRQIKATYCGMVAEVDAQIGRLFATLKASGDWDDTLIVLTSDHAEMMGDHWQLGKGGYHDASYHLPLLIRDPARPQTHGRQIDVITESVDIFPTLLDAMHTAPKHHPDGRSLLPLLSGKSPTDWRDAAHWEFDFRDVSGQKAETWFGQPSTLLNLAVIREARWKYVHFAALPPLLFDLDADPHCLDNLAESPAHLRTRVEMAEKLLAWRARHLDQTLALQELTPNGVVSAW
ncbi:MAG: arylsulfatase family protein [Devosia sp.]|nr:arylsulfatase family protein [Devosia sp.]